MPASAATTSGLSAGMAEEYHHHIRTGDLVFA
jgi:citrate lyase alpha subunit